MTAQKTCNEIIDSIHASASSLTHEQLMQIFHSVQSELARSQQKQKRQFTPGKVVRFRQKDGTILEGTVTRLLKKNVEVHTDQGMWRVAPSLLCDPSDPRVAGHARG